MKAWKYLLVFLILFPFHTLFSQVILDNPPKPNAFIPRNILTNKGTVVIKGKVGNTAYNLLQINVYQNKVLIKNDNYSINVAQNQAAFNSTFDLTAGKYIYTIEFVLKGSSTYTQTIDGIMVGDVYLIQGQSNAVAANYYNININYSKSYSDTFIKSFGTSDYTISNMVQDTAWYRADGENYHNKGCIGEWGLALAKTLLDSFGIPICMLNGAVGGTIINYHTSTPGNPEDLNTIYGRLLYRARKAGVANQVRAILYFQGESDGSNARLHDSLFRTIYSSWNRDYKGFKKLYVVQVRGKGCGSPSIQLREYQRQFEFALPKCKVISSNGLNNHDGCHYGFTNGYELLGKQLAALVSRDLYQGKTISNIDPPNMRDCYYSHADQNEITINMYQSSDQIYTDPLFYKLFQIEGDNSVVITNGFIRKNKIVLQLNKSSCLITGVTYDSDIATQPWVKNRLGMGLISCLNVPIFKHQMQTSYQGCKKSLISLGEDSITGCKYLWKRLANNKTYTGSRIRIPGDSLEKFSLVISYGASVCKNKDTLTVYMLPDQIQIPELGNNRTICKTDSVIFKPNSDGFNQFRWKNGLNDIPGGFSCRISSPGKIILTAASQNKCIYKDSVWIAVSNPIIDLGKDISICTGTDTLLSIADSFMTYYWNQLKGTYQLRSGPGKLKVEVQDQYACKAFDSIYILSFPVIQKPILNFKFCKNQTLKIARPDKFYAWSNASDFIADSLETESDETYPITLLDSYACAMADTIITSGLPIPVFSMGGKSGFCKNSFKDIELPKDMYEYNWNHFPLSKNSVAVDQPGTYIASVSNTYGCSFSDTISLSEYPLPELVGFFDTTLCKGHNWYPVSLKDSNTYMVDYKTIGTDYFFNQDGIYHIKAENSYGCSSEKNIEIKLESCNSGVSTLNSKNILIYPNPLHGILMVESTGMAGKKIIITNQEGKMIYETIPGSDYQEIDLSALSGGLYHVSIDNKHFVITKL